MGRLYGPFEKSSSRRNLLGKRKELDSVEKTLEKDFLPVQRGDSSTSGESLL